VDTNEIRYKKTAMRKVLFIISVTLFAFSISLEGQQSQGYNFKEGNPANSLPSNIKRVTQFGERADWSHDGKKILFVEKTFGDVYEIEPATGKISLITGHFYHGGFTRALYLANGDVLLSGSTSFDAANPQVNRQRKAELWILDKSYLKPPVRLGTKCSEGPAVSRKNLKIAWTIVSNQYPDSLTSGQYLFLMADIIYRNGVPSLENKKVIFDNTGTPFRDIEVQNFVPYDENLLTFSAYEYRGSEAMMLDIRTGEVKDMSNADNQYDEPEGIFPDGRSTCVESNRETGAVDIYKLKLDGTGTLIRLTSFSDYKGYKSSNPVISDDGRFMAFQLAKATDLAGIGYGIFIMDLK
jgi:Tol biopolymer transport system component